MKAKWDGKKKAVVLTTVMTAVVLALRIVLMPMMQEAHTGRFRLSYIVIAIMLLTLLAAALLIWRSEKRPVVMVGPPLTAAACGGVLCGAVMALGSLYEFFMWQFKGILPAPAMTKPSSLQYVVLAVSLVGGILGGVFLVLLGLQWLQENRSRSGVFRLMALAPSVWIWFRLARYEMTYASAVNVTESFYDFVMLIFILLFFFSFARYVSGVGETPSKLLFWYALGTALMAVSAPLTRFGMYLLGNTAAYNSSELAGFIDLAVGLFALLFAYAQAFGKQEVPEPAEAVEPTTVAATEPPALSVADEPPAEHAGDTQE